MLLFYQQITRIMKLKLYHDTRKKFRDCVDAWTIYVPYPKWLREKTCGTMGTFLGCTPTETGMIRCIWEHDERRCGRPYFGKKIDPKDTPKAFQKFSTTWRSFGTRQSPRTRMKRGKHGAKSKIGSHLATCQ